MQKIFLLSMPGIVEWIFILIALIIPIGISIFILKMLKKKVTVWKVIGLSLLVLFIINLIMKLLK